MLVALAAVCVLAGAAALGEERGIRDAMRVIVENLRILVALSMKEGALDDPANESLVLNATREIEDQASVVSEHAAREDTGVLASFLDRQAWWMRRSFEWGRTQAVRELLYDTLDICIACHTRLASPNDSPVARDFLADASVADLLPLDRARLQIATRQFHDALDSLESVLASPGTSAGDRDTAMNLYLRLSLRVTGSSERAASELDVLAKRPGIEPATGARLRDWAREVREIAARPSGGVADLATARELVASAEARDRSADLSPVPYIAAGGLLHRYLEGREPEDADRSEAYYLLGLCEYRGGTSRWLPEVELYLEESIRLAPQSESAALAMTVLRDKLGEQFEGDLPDEVEMHLRLLEEEIEAGGR